MNSGKTGHFFTLPRQPVCDNISDIFKTFAPANTTTEETWTLLHGDMRHLAPSGIFLDIWRFERKLAVVQPYPPTLPFAVVRPNRPTRLPAEEAP
jgi:hypothetical protein